MCLLIFAIVFVVIQKNTFAFAANARLSIARATGAQR
jgi:hypothetical protein